jgi:hypothetical protein
MTMSGTFFAENSVQPNNVDLRHFRMYILFDKRLIFNFPVSLSFPSSEENVYKLCEQAKKTNPSELSKSYAVFVSNERRTVPLWRQKAGRGDEKLVIWVSACTLYESNF